MDLDYNFLSMYAAGMIALTVAAYFVMKSKTFLFKAAICGVLEVLIIISSYFYILEKYPDNGAMMAVIVAIWAFTIGMLMPIFILQEQKKKQDEVKMLDKVTEPAWRRTNV
ncbi:MAG: hypothetical protein V1835_07275 [Candidatus Micrarchaeota archaeon]